jgi:drug/metabolite transporter (DMT)-like permease
VAASAPPLTSGGNNPIATTTTTTWRVHVWIALQAILGAVRLYLNFSCLEYLPLGDALTIIFTEPLFTVILSFILLRIAVGIFKVLLCFGLLSGMILSVQPPFIFGNTKIMVVNDNNTTATAIMDAVNDGNSTSLNNDVSGDNPDYYTGNFKSTVCQRSAISIFC